MLCIYVEYCVTSRAGKCLETCNTDKPRFDDFVAVRASYASVQLALPALFRLLCPSEIPRPRLDTAIEIFLTKKLHRRSYLLVERHNTFLFVGRNFASNPRPLASTGQLLSKFFLVQGRLTSFQMEIVFPM